MQAGNSLCRIYDIPPKGLKYSIFIGVLIAAKGWTGSLREIPGKLIYINGQTWTPTWTTNGVSSEFEGVNPPFLARLGQKIEVTKKVGRGVASIQQFPSVDNDQTMAARIDDDDFGGADWYEIVISW